MAKVWFITGVSSGFGAALAQAVIEKGDMVAATFRKEEQANAFTEQYNGKGTGLVMDLTLSKNQTSHTTNDNTIGNH